MSKLNSLRNFQIIALLSLILFIFSSCSEPDNSPPALTGSISIKGNAHSGEELSVNLNNLYGSGIIKFEWMRSGNIIIGTDSTYILTNDEIGSAITVTVTRSENSGSITSSPTIIIAEAIQTQGLAFNLNIYRRTYSVSKGTATDTDVIIPAIYNGLPVTEIGSFNDYTNLTSITIPDSVTSIGQSAFTGTGIWNNSPVNEIVYADKWAVGYKGTINNILLGSDTRGICSHAFKGCSNIISITIPSNVTSINTGVFEDCSRLESITVESGNTVYRSEGNCLIHNTDNVLIAGCKNSVIPASVTEISSCAFWGHSGLTSVIIPKNVTRINDGAFTFCYSLITVFYNGSNITDWNNIYLANNELLKNAARYYYSEMNPGTENLHWRYVNGIPTVW